MIGRTGFPTSKQGARFSCNSNGKDLPQRKLRSDFIYLRITGSESGSASVPSVPQLYLRKLCWHSQDPVSCTVCARVLAALLTVICRFRLVSRPAHRPSLCDSIWEFFGVSGFSGRFVVFSDKVAIATADTLDLTRVRRGVGGSSPCVICRDFAGDSQGQQRGELGLLSVHKEKMWKGSSGIRKQGGRETFLETGQKGMFFRGAAYVGRN